MTENDVSDKHWALLCLRATQRSSSLCGVGRVTEHRFGIRRGDWVMPLPDSCFANSIGPGQLYERGRLVFIVLFNGAMTGASFLYVCGDSGLCFHNALTPRSRLIAPVSFLYQPLGLTRVLYIEKLRGSSGGALCVSRSLIQDSRITSYLSTHLG
jgi:hypothetical protein